jgi:hypothetical protein
MKNAAAQQKQPGVDQNQFEEVLHAGYAAINRGAEPSVDLIESFEGAPAPSGRSSPDRLGSPSGPTCAHRRRPLRAAAGRWSSQSLLSAGADLKLPIRL